MKEFSELDSYENVTYFRSLYFAEKSADNLRNLIVSYLNIYDFINFEKFAQEYIAMPNYTYNSSCVRSMDLLHKLLDSLAGSKFIDVGERKEELAFFRKQFETHE